MRERAVARYHKSTSGYRGVRPGGPTSRQLEVLGLLDEMSCPKCGRGPTMRMLAVALGVRSHQAIQQHLVALARKRLVRHGAYRERLQWVPTPAGRRLSRRLRARS